MRDVFAWLICESLAPMALVAGHHNFYIGRSSDCNLILPHSAVSKRHALIKVDNKIAILEDLESANGTFVNGRKIAHQVLRFDDFIEIKPFVLRYRSKDAAQEESNTTQEIPTSLFLTSKSVLTGRLKNDSLVELFQSLEFNQKSCGVMVYDSQNQGYVIFSSGRPIRAVFGKFSGIKAVLAMLQSKNGHFSVTSEIPAIKETSENTINCPMTSILLEASRQVDESSETSRLPQITE